MLHLHCSIKYLLCGSCSHSSSWNFCLMFTFIFMNNILIFCTNHTFPLETIQSIEHILCMISSNSQLVFTCRFLVYKFSFIAIWMWEINIPLHCTFILSCKKLDWKGTSICEQLKEHLPWEQQLFYNMMHTVVSTIV